MTESIQNRVQNRTQNHGTTLCADETERSNPELEFWRFAAEQYGIWLDEEQWCDLAELDDRVLIARRFFWRLSDPEVHELLCALPDPAVSHEIAC